MKDPKKILQEKYFPDFVIDGSPDSKKGGGQGFTYLLKEKGNYDNIQVLKLLKYDRLKTRTRFHIERTALATLSTESVNVPKLISSNSEEYLDQEIPLFIISEYIEGQTLSEFIDRKEVVSLDDSLELIIQLFEILQIVHESNIVHRDIKPSNIIITKTNDLFLVDFGLSFDMKATLGPSNPHESLDNVFYSLPELRISGENKRDKRTDISQAFGILYYLLCGQSPLENHDSNGNKPNAREHYKKIVDPKDQVRFDVLDNLFNLAFENNKANRIQSAEEALGLLKKIRSMKEKKTNLKDLAKKLNKQLLEESTLVKKDRARNILEESLKELKVKILEKESEIEPFRIDLGIDNASFTSNENQVYSISHSIYHKLLPKQKYAIEIAFLLEGDNIRIEKRTGAYLNDPKIQKFGDRVHITPTKMIEILISNVSTFPLTDGYSVDQVVDSFEDSLHLAMNYVSKKLK